MNERPTYDYPDPELTITLDAPIQAAGGGPVQEITLREPTAMQVRQAEGNLRAGVNPEAVRKYQIALVTSVSRLSQQVIDQLPVSKLTEAADYLQGFITPSPRTGSN